MKCEEAKKKWVKNFESAEGHTLESHTQAHETHRHRHTHTECANKYANLEGNEGRREGENQAEWSLDDD